jgi:type II secretory pathway component PulJ
MRNGRSSSDWRTWLIGALGAIVLLGGTLVLSEVQRSADQRGLNSERIARLETQVVTMGNVLTQLTIIENRLTRIETKLDAIERKVP